MKFIERQLRLLANHSLSTDDDEILEDHDLTARQQLAETVSSHMTAIKSHLKNAHGGIIFDFRPVIANELDLFDMIKMMKNLQKEINKLIEFTGRHGYIDLSEDLLHIIDYSQLILNLCQEIWHKKIKVSFEKYNKSLRDEQERLKQERLEQERLEKERLKQERLEQERLEQERLERREINFKDPISTIKVYDPSSIIHFTIDHFTIDHLKVIFVILLFAEKYKYDDINFMVECNCFYELFDDFLKQSVQMTNSVNEPILLEPLLD